MIDALVETGELTPDQLTLLKSMGTTGDGESKCPFAAVLKGEIVPEKVAEPLPTKSGNGPVSNVYKGAVDQVLNEIGVMSEMDKTRQKYTPK